jgi:hypothetical protein
MKKKKSFTDEFFDQLGISAISDLITGKGGKTEIIKRMSTISAQKKESRLVINLPEWLKTLLSNKAKETNKSMNEIIRTALIEFLAKDES